MSSVYSNNKNVNKIEKYKTLINGKNVQRKKKEKVENKIKWQLMQNNRRLHDGQKIRAECSSN